MKTNESTYYKAILQNLFFATLNQEMNTTREIKRKFRIKNQSYFDSNYGISNLYRYADHFNNPKEATSLFATIPFLNGGLFECLDQREKNNMVDGFSDSPSNQPIVPNELFWANDETVDLNTIYDTRNKKYTVRGLIRILNGYKFTIEENTPLEEDVALDPELLGRVFENLLASYNPETGTTARKTTGSFYTPREIVNYMVDESLSSYLMGKLIQPTEYKPDKNHFIDPRLRVLLSYSNDIPAFTDVEIDRLIEGIDKIKVLDPACGSGAFPMGILHQLVNILRKLDPGNEKWLKRQLERARQGIDPSLGDRMQDHQEQIEQVFSTNERDYARKLFLIQNCIYGVDIQPIAVQIAKLRFFISLVVDQPVNDQLPNRGVLPLPNLETNFVSANTSDRIRYRKIRYSSKLSK